MNAREVPGAILWDIPRTAQNYVNYCALKEVKNVFSSNIDVIDDVMIDKIRVSTLCLVYLVYQLGVSTFNIRHEAHVNNVVGN